MDKHSETTSGGQPLCLTRAELLVFVEQQKKIFDIVRLVDVAMMAQYNVMPDGSIVKQPFACHAVWEKNTRCENCISAKAIATKGKLTKFEFVRNLVYFVVTQYAEIDTKPCVIEMVMQMNDETLFGAYGRESFISTIGEYNRKIYRDSLTGTYNRRYFDEQIAHLDHINAIALLDVDHFKQVNDTYGHVAGDHVLQQVVNVLYANVRTGDTIIRIGGDEFLLLFQDISLQALPDRLRTICNQVGQIRLDCYPGLTLSISAGSVFGACANRYLDLADKTMYEAKHHHSGYLIKTLD